MAAQVPLAVIRAQQAAIEELTAAIVQLQTEQQQERQRFVAERTKKKADTFQLEASFWRVEAAGGIFGYNNGNILLVEERDFKSLLMSFGIDKSSSNEVFCQGSNRIESLRQITSGKL